MIADPVIADAIRDRLEHSALTLHITGESYRGVKARKLANKKKDGQESSPTAPPLTPPRWVPTQEIAWSPSGKSCNDCRHILSNGSHLA